MISMTGSSKTYTFTLPLIGKVIIENVSEIHAEQKREL